MRAQRSCRRTTQKLLGEAGSQPSCRVFRNVIGNRKRSQRATGDQQLLADGHDFDQLRGIAVEVDHVARLFRGHRSGVHGHAHVGRHITEAS